MFIKTQTESKLDAEILSALSELKDLDKKSKEYATLVEHISKLHKLKIEERPRFKPISPDTMLVVAANIFGILWLARFEKTEVIKAPNAMRHVMKPK
jgi:hypothetical protein